MRRFLMMFFVGSLFVGLSTPSAGLRQKLPTMLDAAAMESLVGGAGGPTYCDAALGACVARCVKGRESWSWVNNFGIPFTSEVIMLAGDGCTIGCVVGYERCIDLMEANLRP
jgi:hypothetical protein